MKVLVTGGSGMIGSKFVADLTAAGNEVSYTYLSRNNPMDGAESVKLDVSDRKAVMSLIENFRPELTIHCSAITKVDFCETSPDVANKVNVQGTRNVVDGCRKVDSKMIYISTSFVFDGSKKFYREDEETHAINQYGLTKLRGEEITKKSGQPFMIFRTDHPYRWSPHHIEKNNIMRMIGLYESGNSFREADDWFNTPTLVDDIVEVGRKLAQEWEDGIYHLVGPDFVSRYQLAMEVAGAIGGDKSLVERVKSSVFNLPTNRPNVHLVNIKAEEKTGIKMHGISDGIREILRQKKESSVVSRGG